MSCNGAELAISKGECNDSGSTRSGLTVYVGPDSFKKGSFYLISIYHGLSAVTVV